eukprot:SAG31_NODE_10622_length_1116_cov_1.223206_1_plen_93_part_00
MTIAQILTYADETSKKRFRVEDEIRVREYVHGGKLITNGPRPHPLRFASRMPMEKGSIARLLKKKKKKKKKKELQLVHAYKPGYMYSRTVPP